MSLIKALFGSDKARALHDPNYWIASDLLGRQTMSGEAVSVNHALTLPAYYSAMRSISEDVAKVSFKVFKRLDPRGKEPQPRHPVFKLIHSEPNEEMSAFTLRETLTSYALGWGNGYAEIEVNQKGDPVALWPIHPSRVTPRRVGRPNNLQLVYDVISRVGDDKNLEVPISDPSKEFIIRLRPERVFHLHGLGSNGITGYSVAQIAAESIGLSLAQQRYASTFYGNGASLNGILVTPEKLNDESLKRIRESWESVHRGAVRAHKTAILEQGLDWKQTSVNPKDAQFLEGRSFSIEEVARWFRIPPHKIQHLARSTFTNIESQNLEYVTDTLMAWFVRWEQETDRKLITNRNLFFSKHNANSLMRGDSIARSNFYRNQFNLGALSPNDIRELEDMNPIGPEGDKYFMQLNLAPVGAIASGTPQQGRSNQVNEPEQVLDLNKPIFMDASRRVLTKQFKAIENNIKKHNDINDFQKWVIGFFEGQSRYIFTTFQPICETTKSLIDINAESIDEIKLTKVIQGFVDRDITNSLKKFNGELNEDLEKSVLDLTYAMMYFTSQAAGIKYDTSGEVT